MGADQKTLGDRVELPSEVPIAAPRPQPLAVGARAAVDQAQPGSRAKTPMPPAGFLQELNIPDARWRDGAELASLERNVEAMLGTEAESVANRDYEDLRGCLPDPE